MTLPQRSALDPRHAFAFVRSLAEELSRGPVEIPAFPDVVARIRDALADEEAPIERIVRIVGSEPALAARLLTMANSVFLNPSRQPVRDLRTAIARIGHTNVRGASISFAVSQLKQAARLASVRRHLAGIWRESTLVSALCFYVARQCGKVDADESLLAGLLHAVGKLYILGRADQHPELLAEPLALEQAQREWHANIGKAILQNWKFPDEMAEAVGGYEDTSALRLGPADLTDVLQVGVALAARIPDATGLDEDVQQLRAFGRLGLDAPACRAVLGNSATEIDELRLALGG